MIGKTVLHYRIISQLGAGGMGVVYKAEDLNLRRMVALKFLPVEATRDPEIKRRFFNEARAASALDHPNICSVHEINETSDGLVFMVMACYTGQTLNERVRQGPLPIPEALRITMQTAEGLAKAHQKGIIHRDIKPGNILLSEDGLVKILDFGLAKLAGASVLTQDGITLGTVAYMSPEQSRGEAVDRRTDIWSLGVVLYEMLAGRPPFAGDYPQSIIYGIQNETPAPMTSLRSGVPLQLEHILNKTLAKAMAERYQSLDDLLVDL
ncbi:MAG: serine/threonine-protein kinase, partial [Candidatus Aminicenantes bacterium]|nr:serine/threonine-protein kinase [Candidatus Aminicenantes bacterium]